MRLWRHVRKLNTLFLTSTLLTTLVGVPWYIWKNGIDFFQAGLFLFFVIATGLSITLGYHRLFSHFTFRATWPVKLFTLLFGAAAFEGSVLGWSADHRRHHKHVDHDDDPHDISRGFFHAHIGRLLFRTGPHTPLSWVREKELGGMARRTRGRIPSAGCNRAANAARPPNSFSPYGLQPFLRCSALLARPRPQRVLALRSRLEHRKNGLQRTRSLLFSQPLSDLRTVPEEKIRKAIAEENRRESIGRDEESPGVLMGLDESKVGQA